jgi:hypothetical protein
MASTLRGSIVIHDWEMMNPNKKPVITYKTHLRGFKKYVFTTSKEYSTKVFEVINPFL